MTIIVIDGPEKAGKTTLIKELKDTLLSMSYEVRIRKWGKPEIDDREYTPALIEDNRFPNIIAIWDRGWASEHVYPVMTGRESRLGPDPWLGEWLHGRAADIKVMVLPDSPKDMELRRTPDDLPVNPFQESMLFERYAARFHWMAVWNNYTSASLQANLNKLLFAVTTTRPRNVSVECGQLLTSAPFLFIGEYAPAPFEGDGKSRIPGTWLPFSDIEGIAYARQLGDSALAGAWATAGYSNAKALREAKRVVYVDQADIPATERITTELERSWSKHGKETVYR